MDLLAIAQNLIDTAKSILSETNTPDQETRLLRYVDEFEALAKRLSEVSSLTETESKALLELESMHAQVIQTAEQLRNSAAQDLRDVRQRMKGFSAYAGLTRGSSGPRKIG